MNINKQRKLMIAKFLQKKRRVAVWIVVLVAAVTALIPASVPSAVLAPDAQSFAELYEAGVDISTLEDKSANITEKLLVHDKDSDEKVAYLTFDDGPTAMTERVLDTLSEYGVKATFFVLGETASYHPEILKRVYEEGHSIGNHTYSHDYDVVYGTREQFENELIKWEETVGEIIGKENVQKLLRFPGGSKDDWKYIYRMIAGEMGYKFVDWNALNGDADGQPFSHERCMEEIYYWCGDTGDVIILMHDSAKKVITADMLPEIIEFLMDEGYTFDKIEVN